MYKLLLVEDEERMREVLSDYFESKGCKLDCVGNGLEALEYLADNEYDLILLDIMMPKLDGFSTCRKIRKTNEVPIIFVTAKVDESNFLKGYELGADDYVTKPFSLSVLYAKAISLIKRSKGMIVENKLRTGEICMDCQRKTVAIRGEEVGLAPKEYKLLEYLLHNKNQILSREQILVKLWGYEFSGNDRVLDNHIKKLRKALGEEGKLIRTVIKIGYRLEDSN